MMMMMMMMKSNTKDYGGKTPYTDSQNIHTTAPSGKELYHLQFSLQAASPETSGYTIVYHAAQSLKSQQAVSWPRIILLLRNSNAQYRVHKSPPLDFILNQTNPYHIVTLYFFKSHF
jgi:hypothetical protein